MQSGVEYAHPSADEVVEVEDTLPLQCNVLLLYQLAAFLPLNTRGISS